MVDGNDAALMNLPGPPDPARYLEAARRLDLPAVKVAVVVSALPGIEAGRKGGFGLVAAVRTDAVTTGPMTTDALTTGGDGAGAHVVVPDLGELGVTGRVLPLTS